jgi:hypothetical protein
VNGVSSNEPELLGRDLDGRAAGAHHQHAASHISLLVHGGLVVINETTFRANGSADASGAIVVRSGATVVVTNSSFVENVGGGVPDFGGNAILNLGTLRVRNTTFAGNVSKALFAGPIAIANSGQLSLVNSTFAGNVADPVVSVGVSSVLSSGPNATTILKNTIIVHDPSEPLIQDCQGTITSLGNNLIGDLRRI